MAKKLFIALGLAVLSMPLHHAAAAYPLNFEVSTTGNAGTGAFAPYYIASNCGGVLTQPMTLQERGKIWKPIETGTRFSYGFGADLIAEISKGTRYEVYDTKGERLTTHSVRPSWGRVQQLWGGVRYRSLFLKAGMWEQDRSLFDGPLSIGDITLSNNARPIPQVKVGFQDFVDIPLTNKWVQIRGDIAYGKFTDAKWLEDHYNYYNYFITTGVWFHSKHLYLRSNPSQPFSVTVGMTHAAQFGGTYRAYHEGKETEVAGEKVKLKDFLDVFYPHEGKKGESYYNGNHLGSWDFQARYRFPDGRELIASWQSPWEDGSGIGKMNGFDGMYGLEYRSNRQGWLEAASVQYLDFTNQSGPIHYAPADMPDSPYTGESTGADDYYNNYFYNGWQNYGMSIGTPFVPSTLYNRDGYMRFADNMVRGFQVGLMGSLSSEWSYRTLFSWRKSKGTPFVLRGVKPEATSMLVEATYRHPTVKGLSVKGQLAWDAGRMYGSNFGVLVSVAYVGEIFK